MVLINTFCEAYMAYDVDVHEIAARLTKSQVGDWNEETCQRGRFSEERLVLCERTGDTVYVGWEADGAVEIALHAQGHQAPVQYFLMDVERLQAKKLFDGTITRIAPSP